MAKNDSLQLNIRQVGDWSKTSKLLNNLKRHTKFMNLVVAAEAKRAAKLVRQNLLSRGKLTGTKWPRLKRLTLKTKKSKSTLVESRQMLNAINATDQGGGKWFIGVSSDATHKGRGGGSVTLARLAATHENGATIVQVWSLKQKRAFFALLAKTGMRRTSRATAKARSRRRGEPAGGNTAKGMTVVIRIPPRPFVYPVLEKLYLSAQSDLEKRIMKRVESALKLPKQGKAPKLK